MTIVNDSMLRTASSITETFGLYIHWPFCRAKCPYCDFNSHVRAAIDEQEWCQALLQELDYVGQQTHGRTLTSVFFGGGTPSLMSAETVGKLLEKLSDYWHPSPTLEVTLEANPNSVEANKFKDFKRAGVNRLSLGIQALRDDALKFLGRVHDRREAIQAIQTAAAIFPRYSFDLIYARPQQIPTEWRQELTEALTLAGDHLSLYQLTIEPGTAFYTAHHRGSWQIPDSDESAELYQLTQSIMEQHGMPAYEISNHARPGHECQHNLVYWRYQDYACIGPGAHGRLTMGGDKFAIKNIKAPELWRDAVSKNGHGQQEKIMLTPDEQVHECLLMGLRLKEGIPYARIESITQRPLSDSFSNDKLQALVNEGYVDSSPQSLCLTNAGQLRLNSILKFLLN